LNSSRYTTLIGRNADFAGIFIKFAQFFSKAYSERLRDYAL
jgi:hypothetical protein